MEATAALPGRHPRSTLRPHEKKPPMIKVIIVDDHALFRAGLRLILSQQDQIEVVGEAPNGEEALRLAKQAKPDICLMDVQMPGGMGGIEATRRLLRLVPTCRVIALTVLGDDPFPAQLREAGAMGYLTKGCPAEELVKALRLVASGHAYVDSAVAQARMVAQWEGGTGSPFKELSARELQVAVMILDGQRTQDISASLCLSAKTVSTYRTRIYEKLGVHTDVDLTRLAFRYGLINDGSQDTSPGDA
jgi:two-component system invasion response regulator UvrY